MGFISPQELPSTELFLDVFSKLVTGQHIMLSFLELHDGTDVPEHSHPEEQAGLLMEGELLLRIGENEKILTVGDAYLVPPNVVHSARVVKGPMRILDIFGPPRADYVTKISTKS